MKKAASIFLGLILTAIMIAGCAAPTPPVASPTPQATHTETPIPGNTPTFHYITLSPTSPIDPFQIGHPQWRLAFIEPDTRQLCVKDQTSTDCLSYHDYEFPGGFRRQLGSWSPDGTRFAWDHDDDSGIYLWTIGSGVEPFKTSGEGLVYRYPVWSLDGQFIAYQQETVAFSGLSADVEGVYVESLDHTVSYHITQEKSILDWSADGKRILYSENNSDLSEGSIIAANMDGSDPQVILRHTGKVFRPRWSPDGLHIAFLADPEYYKFHLYVMNADGSGLHDLGLFEYGGTQAIYNYSWLPDGKQILYYDQRIDAETGSVTRLFFSFDPSSAIWFMK